jgi:hypothetical protein
MDSRNSINTINAGKIAEQWITYIVDTTETFCIYMYSIVYLYQDQANSNSIGTDSLLSFDYGVVSDNIDIFARI